MASSAPGTERTIRLLEFLAAHPGERFALSELARRLDLHKGTVHPLVGALVDAGWLLRHPGDLSYTLGPAAIRVGDAAAAGFRAIEFARPELAELAERLKVPILASAVVDAEIVVLARAGASTGGLRPGQRTPLVPPFGTVFLAWASAGAIGEWLADAPRSEHDGLLAMLAAVNARGYAVGLAAGSRARVGRALAELGDAAAVEQAGAAELRRVLRSLLDELGHEGAAVDLDPAGVYEVDHIAAPVFGPNGEVELAITAVGFTEPLPGARLRRAGDTLRAAARRVTRAIHGSEP